MVSTPVMLSPLLPTKPPWITVVWTWAPASSPITAIECTPLSNGSNPFSLRRSTVPWAAISCASTTCRPMLAASPVEGCPVQTQPQHRRDHIEGHPVNLGLGNLAAHDGAAKRDRVEVRKAERASPAGHGHVHPGVYRPKGGTLGEVPVRHDISKEQLRRTFQTNIFGMFFRRAPPSSIAPV